MSYQFKFVGDASDKALVVNHFTTRPDSYYGFPTVKSARDTAIRAGHFGFWRVKGSAV